MGEADDPDDSGVKGQDLIVHLDRHRHRTEILVMASRRSPSRSATARRFNGPTAVRHAKAIGQRNLCRMSAPAYRPPSQSPGVSPSAIGEISTLTRSR